MRAIVLAVCSAWLGLCVIHGDAGAQVTDPAPQPPVEDATGNETTTLPAPTGEGEQRLTTVGEIVVLHQGDDDQPGVLAIQSEEHGLLILETGPESAGLASYPGHSMKVTGVVKEPEDETPRLIVENYRLADAEENQDDSVLDGDAP